MLWNMCGVVNLSASQAIRIAYHHRPPTMDLRNPYPATWNTIRVRILERDGRRCSNCDSAENLTVSHINRIEPDCRPANLRTLCRRCHLAYDRADNVRRRRIGRRAHLVQIPLSL